MKNLNRKNMIRTMLMAAIVGCAPLVQAANFPEAGDFARGSQAWADNCNRCHHMRSAPELRDDQWITTVFHMRIRAGLTGQETRDIITFLQTSNNN